MILPRLFPALLGFSLVFLFLGVAMVVLTRAAGRRPGPGWWAAGLFLNGAGFAAWAASATGHAVGFLAAGEVLHVAGFTALVAGAWRFVGRRFQSWHVAVPVALAAAVGAEAALMLRGQLAAVVLLVMTVRVVLFIGGGSIILRSAPGDPPLLGSRLAGWGMILWGVSMVPYELLNRSVAATSAAMGWLVGLHAMIVLGMVVMVVDEMRRRAAESEERTRTLEGLLPICSRCKKIRDEAGEWHEIDVYVTRHSEARFSHGLCEPCLRALYPEVADDVLDTLRTS